MICKECNGRGETIYYEEIDRDENTVTIAQRKSICRTCNGSGETPMTNADWIRSMTEKELAEFIGHNSLCDRVQGEGGNWCNDHNCTDCLEEWLKQPAEIPEDDC